MPDEPVPYQALYRRFRPQRFADVLGQEHVTRALKSAVRDAKVAHAYLFSGPRGTGKTSTARILAMALNCEHPLDGEPDGTCESCVAIRQGSSLDVQELDSATNRGIDEMRDLLSRVALGTPGRWKVYIVDEVHQMTSAASSALLKTLEEPPGHVIFVLATTDPQKVMETIRSRTQHFEFRLLGSDVLGAHLAEVAKAADLEVGQDAIDLAVRRGHGSARDALSVLDQVAAAGGADDDLTAVGDLVDAMVERDSTKVLVAVAEAAQAGMDPRRLGSDLLEYLRNGFLATRARSLVMLSDTSAAEAEARAKALGPAALVRAMETIGAALIDMRDSADARTTLEVALVRLSAPEVDDSRAALLERIERLERAVQAGGGATITPISAPVLPIPSVTSLPPPLPAPGINPSGPSGPSRPALGAHRSPGSAGGPGPAGSPASAGNPGPGNATEEPAGGIATEEPAGGVAGSEGRAASTSHAGVPAGQTPTSDIPAPGRPDLLRPPSGGQNRSSQAGGPTDSGQSRGVGAAPPVLPPRGAREAAPGDPTRLPPPPPLPRSAPQRTGSPLPGAPQSGSAQRAVAAPPAGAAAPPSGGTPPARPATPPSGGTPPAGAAAPPSGGAGTAASLPSREEFTLAWGDRVLASLRPAVKIYVASGRFLESAGDSAVYAVPDKGLLSRAQQNQGEVEKALSEHFGRRIPLRLVLDDGAVPVRDADGAERVPPEDLGEPESEDFDIADLEDVPGAVLSPEQRLLEAFPGAEEVT